MAKRSGGRSSRSERKTGRERAQRAERHGLPAKRAEAPRRAVSSASLARHESENDEPLSARTLGSGLPQKAKIPTLVLVVGGALGLLAVAYGITQFRATPGSSAVSSEVVPAGVTPESSAVAPSLSAAASRAVSAVPEPLPVGAVVPVAPREATPGLLAPPEAPVVAKPSAPVLAPPIVPSPPKPSAPAPAKVAAPVPVKPAAPAPVVKATEAASDAAPPAAAPPPPAAAVPPAAAPPPKTPAADNPY